MMAANVVLIMKSKPVSSGNTNFAFANGSQLFCNIVGIAITIHKICERYPDNAILEQIPRAAVTNFGPANRKMSSTLLFSTSHT